MTARKEASLPGSKGLLLALPLLVAVVFIVLPGLAWAGGTAPAGEVVPLWIHILERFFTGLTAGVLAFGLLHVEIEVLSWAWNKLRGRGAHSRDSKAAGVMVRRFDGHQRLQHLLLMSSFIVLAVTGIPQKFYNHSPFDTIVLWMGGMQTVRIIHRVAAVVMIVDGIYHMLYLVPGLLTLRQGMPWLNPASALQMVPTRKDFTDFYQTVGYLLGLRPELPKSGRFSYMEKFDYWAVGWGLVIMTLSGLIMLLPAMGIKITGTAAIAASLAAHSDEAILATGWILVVHMFHAHLAPSVFPFNKTIFTGNISAERLREEHALEYERWEAQRVGEKVVAKNSEAQPSAEPTGRSRR